MKNQNFWGLGLGLVSSFALFSTSAFGQYFSIRHYEGQFFPKSTHTYSQCQLQADKVAEKIKNFKYYTIISTGCRTYEQSYQVLVEYSADTGLDFDKYESPATTLASCETQLREVVGRLDNAFPNSVIASFCAASMSYKGFFNLRLDYMRPRGFYLDRGPFSQAYATVAQCSGELQKFTTHLASLGAHRVYGDCHPTTQGMDSTVRYTFHYSGFISMEKEFRNFLGSSERDESTCQKENSQFAAGLEKVGVDVILVNCNRTSQGYDSVVSVFEPRRAVVDKHSSAQRYSTKEACVQAMESAKSAIEQKTPVVYGFCKIIPTISPTPQPFWYHTIWFKRPKAPVTIIP
jgi:hypothetical protein